jgi:hypothetical protein
MTLDIHVTVPKYIYDIYADAARRLGGKFTTSQVMSAALLAYAEHLAQEVQTEDSLSGENL